MNGRVYDPILGRFMSPDNYIQAPDNSQSLNRYSYCLNNPLIYTDPSGEVFWPGIWFGNWVIGGLDNWMNKRMSFGQAFGTSPMVIGANYHPGINSWSNTQANAQNFVKQDAANTRTVNDIVAGLKGMDLESPLFGELMPGGFVGESPLAGGAVANITGDYLQIYGEFSFSLGPQIGADLSLGVPILAGFLQGPSMEVKYKPYLRYSESEGWTVGIDREKNNINFRKGYSYPFNSYEKSSVYGVYEHPAFSKSIVETQKGVIQFKAADGIKNSSFRIHWGPYVRPLIFGVGIDFGIEGPYDY